MEAAGCGFYARDGIELQSRKDPQSQLLKPQLMSVSGLAKPAACPSTAQHRGAATPQHRGALPGELPELRLSGA